MMSLGIYTLPLHLLFLRISAFDQLCSLWFSKWRIQIGVMKLEKNLCFSMSSPQPSPCWIWLHMELLWITMIIPHGLVISSTGCCSNLTWLYPGWPNRTSKQAIKPLLDGQTQMSCRPAYFCSSSKLSIGPNWHGYIQVGPNRTSKQEIKLLSDGQTQMSCRLAYFLSFLNTDFFQFNTKVISVDFFLIKLERQFLAQIVDNLYV